MVKQNKGAGTDQHGGADVIMHLKIVRIWADFARERDLMFFTEKHLENMVQWMDEAIEKLEDQQKMIDDITKRRMNNGAFD